MRTMPTRADRARALRDLLVPLIQANGETEQVGGGRFVVWKYPPWLLMLRTPFTRWPGSRDPASHREAVLMQQAKPVLPFGLDVFQSGKVMSLQWAEDGRFELISFRPGPWEVEVLTLGGASTESAPTPAPVAPRRNEQRSRSANRSTADSDMAAAALAIFNRSITAFAVDDAIAPGAHLRRLGTFALQMLVSDTGSFTFRIAQSAGSDTAPPSSLYELRGRLGGSRAPALKVFQRGPWEAEILRCLPPAASTAEPGDGP